MLNINQNFDLKAPVFNFDRDYFNSVEELYAYDTSNVPKYFVTNVGGMLYQYTDRGWQPMIMTDISADGKHFVYLGCTNAYFTIGYQPDSEHEEFPENLTLVDKYGGNRSILCTDSLQIQNYSTSVSVSIDGIDLGLDEKVRISRPLTDEGGVISGIKSITAFTNPSATKVWATDGSIANLPTKFSNLTNDSIYIKGNKGETDARFKIDYNDGDILRSRLMYKPRAKSVGIPELAMLAYDTSGTALSQIRIRPEDNADDGQYVIQIQDVKGVKQVNRVSSLYPNGFSHQNFVDNTTVRLNSNELSFGPGANDNNFQAQLKINKDGITKTNGKATEVFATDGSTVDLTTKADASALDAKANASDVLLKKSANGGYYIEQNSNKLGRGAFAANSTCTASSLSSFAEGYHTQASGSYSHAEGASTKAIGTGSHVEGNDTKAQGDYAHAEGENTKALGNSSHAEGKGTDAQNCSHAEGCYTHAVGTYTHAEGEYTSAFGSYSHAEGFATQSNGTASHSEGNNTKANGYCSHAQGTCNVDYKNAIHSVGIGNDTTRKNAEYIYAKSNGNGNGLVDDTKIGYKYLIGVGGYDGISTDNTTYKSVQEVIADLTARIEQLEKLTANCVSISNVDEQTN